MCGFYSDKIRVSVNFLPAILGPEMAAPILWAPGEKKVLSAGESHVHKIPRFRGHFGFFLGGGKCRFYFYGREDFSDLWWKYFPVIFLPGKLFLKFVSPNFHNILHTEVRDKSKKLSPGAHSGSNVA